MSKLQKCKDILKQYDDLPLEEMDDLGRQLFSEFDLLVIQLTPDEKLELDQYDKSLIFYPDPIQEDTKE